MVAHLGPELWDELYCKFIYPLFPFKAQIASWGQGEAIYAEYLSLLQEEGAQPTEVLELLSALENLPEQTVLQRAASSIMKSNLVDLLFSTCEDLNALQKSIQGLSYSERLLYSELLTELRINAIE